MYIFDYIFKSQCVRSTYFKFFTIKAKSYTIFSKQNFWNKYNSCQFYQSFTGSFCTSRFTLILLVHRVKRTPYKFSIHSKRVFHRFGQANFLNIVSILSPNQISLLPQLHQKTKLVSKVVKTDTKIIILLPKI